MTIRVLVADDSSFVRRAVTRMLGSDAELVVVGHAATGAEAIAQTHAMAPDVVTLDLKMPGSHGLDTLRQIMRERPTPIVLLSAHAQSDAQITLDALEAGAVDFIDKSRVSLMDVYALESELIAKIKAAARSHPRPNLSSEPPPGGPQETAVKGEIGVIVLGASTGGPPVIQLILSQLPRDLGIPILVVQHMPAIFTRAFAERLDAVCRHDVKEAEEGDPLTGDRVLVAPGGHHFGLRRAGAKVVTSLSEDEAGAPFVPSIDRAAASVAAIFGPTTFLAVLTGMGNDGTAGARTVRAAGGIVVAQNEETAVIYGMPRAVVREGSATCTASPDEIIALITRLARKSVPNARTP